MSKQASKNLNYMVNSVVLEDDMDSADLNVTQETPEVTGFSDVGPRRVTGNYNFTESLAGSADFASGQSDATLFGMIASAGVVAGFDPTGGVVGANDPHYDATVVLGTYAISAKVGAGIKFTSELRGNSVLTRAVA